MLRYDVGLAADQQPEQDGTLSLIYLPHVTHLMNAITLSTMNFHSLA